MKYLVNGIVGAAVALITAAAVLLWVNGTMKPLNRNNAIRELERSETAVEKKLDEISARLLSQLKGFCATVANNRDFAMKLIVEREYGAPEVADIAASYIKAMGLAFLEITDADFRILSSGHFPASAGGRASNKRDMPDSAAVFIRDQILGAETVSLQVRLPFSCAGERFFCTGGVIVDEAFLSHLAHRRDLQVVLKHADGVTGVGSVATISSITDHRIIINDTSYLATSLTLPWSGEGDAPALILFTQEPADFTLADIR